MFSINLRARFLNVLISLKLTRGAKITAQVMAGKSIFSALGGTITCNIIILNWCGSTEPNVVISSTSPKRFSKGVTGAY